MLEALYSKKDARIVDILNATYADADLICLQECAGEFIKKLRHSELGSRYLILQTAKPSAADQNSVLLLSRRYFETNKVEDHSDAVVGGCGAEVPVSPGDLIVVEVSDKLERPYLLASFHGDTNGLATLP